MTDPDGDIEIRYTGLRPAEKLYEELLIGNNVSGTEHPMIMRAQEDFLPWPRLRELLDELWNACLQSDCDSARRILLETVAEYSPSVGVEDLVWIAQRAAQGTPEDVGKVTALRPTADGPRAERA